MYVCIYTYNFVSYQTRDVSFQILIWFHFFYKFFFRARDFIIDSDFQKKC